MARLTHPRRQSSVRPEVLRDAVGGLLDQLGYVLEAVGHLTGDPRWTELGAALGDLAQALKPKPRPFTEDELTERHAREEGERAAFEALSVAHLRTLKKLLQRSAAPGVGAVRGGEPNTRRRPNRRR